MKKGKPWFDAMLRACLIAIFGLVLAGCVGEKHVPATEAQLKALPYEFTIEGPFKAFNVSEWRVLLQAEKSSSAKVTPTIEIEVRTDTKSGEFPPQKLLMDSWSELQSFHDLEIVSPSWSQLAGKPAVFVRGVAAEDGGDRTLMMEQKVSKLPQGYARVLAFAEQDEFKKLRPTIERIMMSIQLRD